MERIPLTFEHLGKTYSKLLHEKKIIPIPMVRVTSPDNFLSGISMISLMYGLEEIGLRVTINDITSPDFEGNIEDVLVKIELEPENCHLILDLNDADFTNSEDFADGIVQALSGFPKFQSWKSFTVCGGSFPARHAPLRRFRTPPDSRLHREVEWTRGY